MFRRRPRIEWVVLTDDQTRISENSSAAICEKNLRDLREIILKKATLFF